MSERDAKERLAVVPVTLIEYFPRKNGCVVS